MGGSDLLSLRFTADDDLSALAEYWLVENWANGFRGSSSPGCAPGATALLSSTLAGAMADILWEAASRGEGALVGVLDLEWLG